MAFENSPSLKDPARKRFTLTGTLYKIRPLLLAGTGILILFDILFLIHLISPDTLSRPSGGLDGCLETMDGAPLAATVKIDNRSSSTFEDGCFVFQALSPGEHRLEVETDVGIIYIQMVTVRSDEAVALGTIEIQP